MQIETDCFCTNLPISNCPAVRISRNLAKKKKKKKFINHVNDLSRKILILRLGIFNNTENDLRRITKIAYFIKTVLTEGI